MKNFDQLLNLIKDKPVRSVAVAAADDASVIEAVKLAQQNNIAKAILIGRKEGILKKAAKIDLVLGEQDVIDEPDDIKAAAKAVKLVSDGKADILMKGYIHTDDFLRAVLNRENGLRTGVVMSHVFIIEVPEFDRLLFITDGAMNIAPNLQQKAEIILNAVHLANLFGVTRPKVAVLAAVELVNPNMPVTLDAAVLAKMSQRDQFRPEVIIDGPFALDNAISEIAAKHKNITGPVAGAADILMVPDIEAGNMLAKSLVYFGHYRLAGILMGASAPVVLTSRADSAESKMLSMAAAVRTVTAQRVLRLKIGKLHY
ncbi:MAG: phosphate butyryltransferase [Actinobacteria bacterium]|nr:phosphate butyryltransferase [Actinomycetota bacterium]